MGRWHYRGGGLARPYLVVGSSSEKELPAEWQGTPFLDHVVVKRRGARLCHALHKASAPFPGLPNKEGRGQGLAALGASLLLPFPAPAAWGEQGQGLATAFPGPCGMEGGAGALLHSASSAFFDHCGHGGKGQGLSAQVGRWMS